MRTLYTFPGTCASSPFILVGYKNVRLFFQSPLCLLLREHGIPCCSQHTMLLCIACLEWWYFLCNCNMDWSGIPIILGSLNIYHTTVAHTPCIHMRLSKELDIVPLIHSPHVHFSCVPGSTHTWCQQIIPQSLIGWIYLLPYHHWGMPQGHQKLPRLFLHVHW